MILNRNELTTLIAHEANPCVSIFMPTHKSGRERQQDPIRLKNLISEANEKVRASGVHKPQDFLEPVETLRGDDEFWENRQDGLALFCAGEFFRYYRVPLLLESAVHVNSRFYVRPLIPLLQGNSRFFLLALSQSHAQLFESTRYSIRDMNLEATLATVEQAFSEHDEDQTLQFRTLIAGTREKGPAIFHGHGGASDVSKQDIMKYFRSIDRGVSKILQGESAPLVLACVGYLASIYESANSYSGLIREKVPGSPEMWEENELRDRAWELASPVLSKHRDDALHRFEDACGTERVTTDVREIVLAASDGRIDALFMEKGKQVWGDIDRDLRAVHIANDGNSTQGEELLDFAAGQTLVHDGHVYMLDRDNLPTTESPAAALLRYAA